MKRRSFLKTIFLSGAAITLPIETINAASNKISVTKNADLVAVMGGEPDVMLRRALDEIGGIGKYVKKGNKVVIKPNIGWDKKPEMAANTNPQLIGELTKLCLAAGAKEVIVFDHSCDNWVKTYATSGIKHAVEAAGGKMVPANEESTYREVALPKGESLKSVKIHEAILNCDVWFNVPILKHHGGAKMSISMKNLMGIVWDRQKFHRSNLQQCIADCATFEKAPALNIVDAYRVLKTNGPQGKTVSDTATLKALFISHDYVAVDTAAVKFFNQIREMHPADVSHIALAEKLKVGTSKLDKLKIKRIKL